MLRNELEIFFKETYRKIWIQKSSLSICLILFPINKNANYKMIVKSFWLKDNELNFDNLKYLILNHEN